MQRSSIHPPPHSGTRPRPVLSPSTSASVSPVKRGAKSLSRPAQGSPGSEEDELASGDDEPGSSTSKLEQKREKNRIKQRNLRLRRQNHINELEADNAGLQNEINQLRNNIAQLQQRENNLTAWIRDLESALFGHGLSTEVNQLRRIWATNKNDPLATLARAAAVTGGGMPFAPSASSQAGSHTTLYATNAVPWDRQQPDWPQDRKRKRDGVQPQAPPHEPPHAHRQDTLAPIQSLPPSRRPALPSYESDSRRVSAHLPPIEAVDSLSQSRTVPVPLREPLPQYSARPGSPHHLRISDLLSPTADDNNPWAESRLSFDSQAELDVASERRWSVGELSVIDNSLATDLSAPLDQALAHAQTSASYTINPYPTLPVAFTQNIHQTFPTITHTQSARVPAPTIPLDLNIPRLDLHPAILACRSLLLSLLPHPLPYPLPPLPSLEPAHQKLLLLALTALVPQADQPTFHQRQLKFIPAEDAKRLLQYQADPSSDARLVLFPIAIMRAKAVQALMAGRDMDVTAFVNDTLGSARIFGATLDPDAWEMPHWYWDVWEPWIPRGRAYCHSLSQWRRRGGHKGSTVVEMILGMEGDHARRADPVGKPPNWTF